MSSPTSAPSLPFAAIAGAKLRYERSGKGSAVVLLHPGAGDLTAWDHVAPELAADHEVIRYDARGFGASDLPSGPFAHHEDLRALLDELGIDQVSLVGLSLGGRTALDFALAFPDRARSLVLANSGISGYPPGDFGRYEVAFEAAKERGDLDEVAEVLTQVWGDGPRRAPPDMDPAVRARIRGWFRHHHERTRSVRWEQRLLDPPAAQRLAEIQVPVLVVLSELDHGIIREQAECLQRGIAGSELVVVANAAHFVNLERPREFSALVTAFLRER